MPDPATMANVNLYAVLRNIEDLVTLDEEAGKLIAGRREAIGFSVHGGPRGVLSFDGKGGGSFVRGAAKTSISLWFSGPEHFNSMVAGSGSPIPLKGLTKLSFLTGPFTMLTKRLESYLRPSPEALADPAIFKATTELTLYTAGFALAEVGNADPVGMLNAGRIPDGIIEIGIKDGPAVSLTAKGGCLSAAKGRTGKARASMTFADYQAASGVLGGRRDAMTALGLGEVAMSGFIPMLEHMNKVLGLVPRYLA